MLFKFSKIILLIAFITNIPLLSMVEFYRTKELVITSLKTIIIKKNTSLNQISLNEFHSSPKFKMRLNINEFDKSKTIILCNFNFKKKKYDQRHMHNPCMKWVAGKLIDTCKNSDWLSEFMAATVSVGVATGMDQMKKLMDERSAKVRDSIKMYNNCAGTINSARDAALNKAVSQGKFPHSGPHSAKDDKVYSRNEVQKLRKEGVQGAILTVDANGSPVYDLLPTKEGVIAVDSKTGEAKPISELLGEQKKPAEIPVSEYKEQKKAPQNKDKTGKASSTAASGDPKDPRNGNNKNDKKDNQKSDNPVGKHGKYQDAGYHHKNSTGTVKNPGPKNGQAALNNSIQIKNTSPRRIGISEGEIVILDQTTEGLYHGHVRTWQELTADPNMATAINNMIKSGLIDKHGNILK